MLRARRLHARYQRTAARLPALEPFLARLRLVLGDHVEQLPCETQRELLSPELQQFPHRRAHYKRLRALGGQLLDVHLNGYLGTQNASIGRDLLRRFAAENHLATALLRTPQLRLSSAAEVAAAADLVKCGVATAHTVLDDEACKTMVHKHLLADSGLASLYLRTLGSHL